VEEIPSGAFAPDAAGRQPSNLPARSQKPASGSPGRPAEASAEPARAERCLSQPREPNSEVEAFFARNVRPGGPLPPKQT
jgi:hypothetical protein